MRRPLAARDPLTTLNAGPAEPVSVPPFTVSACIEMLFAEGSYPERARRAADAGAGAVEIWGHDDVDLDALTDACADAGVELVSMVGSGAPLVDPDGHDAAVADIRDSIAVAEAHDVPTLIVTVGQARDDLDRETQRDAVVDALAAVAPDAEDAGVTLVVEPLNTAVDHAGYFLAESGPAFDILREVDSPRVQLLYDVYHQQVTEGNIIETLTDNLDLVGHVHIADVPGRHEPGTGELNYENVLGALAEAGYDAAVGCEYRPTVDDADALGATLDRL